MIPMSGNSARKVRMVSMPSTWSISSMFCAGVSGGMEPLRAPTSLKPDVVVTDMVMPGLDGIEAGRQSPAQRTADAANVPTMHNDAQLVGRAREAGIRGFVLKVDAAEELVGIVRRKQRGL